jgi:hypothetical protein
MHHIHGVEERLGMNIIAAILIPLKLHTQYTFSKDVRLVLHEYVSQHLSHQIPIP